MATDAKTQTAPIISGAGADSAESRTAANNTLSTSADTLAGAGKAYGDMATTGGFSDADKTAYLNRATQASTQAGNAFSDQTKLAAAKTGQGNPQAAISRIARQAGQNASEATNNAEVGLNSQINSNKLAGAGGEVSTGNAQTNIGQTQANMSNQSAQQRLAALGLQFNSEAEAQQALDSLSHNPGVFDNIMRVGTAAAGAATGLGVRV